MSDNIKVVVKVRPLISREVEEKLSYRWRVRNNALHQLDQNGRETDVCYTFDKVYDKDTKTEEVYNDIAKPIVEAAIAGFNGTIFAYGQTSSGKTYTMTGNDTSPGIIPLAVLNLFKIIKTVPDRDFLVRVSYIEIYNETLKDLLNVEKRNIKICDTVQGVKVDCSERVTSSPEEVLEAMKEGEANRHTGATNANEESSRSHTIFQITIESREHIEGEEEESGCVNVSQLNLVDLAGSERAGQTGATGIRFKEGTHINKSLSSLALVIKQLSEDPKKFANYRDSKLTRILQNSLGGNAKTSIICAITPASVEETVSTLQFANRAKAIKNKPEVNAVATDATMIQSLTKQLSKLQAELVAKRKLEVMLENKMTVEQELQKQIAGLEKFILNGLRHQSSIDTGRRKPVAPRRMTISTLHHVQEEPAPSAPRFCTPSLKYNPMSLSTDFLPVKNTTKLDPVPEEARMVTPPKDKQVNLEEEIIEIDSDEDSLTKPCSPYHKCYGATKTPPCILRKNAQQAEKNLKDIVELTEREKIYTPNVVELIEKLEQNTNVIAKLQEEITSLTEQGKEKDSKIKDLTNKVNQSEEEVKNVTSAKMELEVKCKKKDTQLTDWEVSYETLIKKAKLREQDLLSLLKEHQLPKKEEDLGKVLIQQEKEPNNFMIMSKVTSLQNSDNETNETHVNADCQQMQELLTNMQTELANKNQTIIELEADIFRHKQKIESLEISSQQRQAVVDKLKQKNSNIEMENSFLKQTIENLNSTVENQRKNLESADKDIQSYNSTIQELQIKLTKKDNMKVNDSAIETMIANEEKFIANNENIKNIIHSFRIAIDEKKKEFEELQAKLSADNSSLKQEIENKEQQINILFTEAEKLKDNVTENVLVIRKLLKSEEELTNQLTSVQKQNETLQKQNTNIALEIENLSRENEKYRLEIQNLQKNSQELTRVIAEKDTNEQNMTTDSNKLSEQIRNMSLKIQDLEKDLKTKQVHNEELARIVSEMKVIENIMTQKISDLEHDLHIKQMNNDELGRIVAEKEDQAQNIYRKNQELTNQLDDATIKIDKLEKDISEELINLKKELFESQMEKDKIIQKSLELQLKLDDKESKELAKIQSLLFKLHAVLVKLNGNSDKIQEISNNMEQVLQMLDNKLSELDNSVNIVLQTNDDLQHQIRRLTECKVEMELSNSEIDKINNDMSIQIQGLLLKLHNILVKLNGDAEEAPEESKDIGKHLDMLKNKLDNLDNSINLVMKSSEESKQQITKLNKAHENELGLFNSQIEKLDNTMLHKIAELKQNLSQLTETLAKSNAELESKNQEIVNLEIALNDIKESNENLRNDLLSKDNIISLIRENMTSICFENEQLRKETTEINAKIQNSNENYEVLLKEKCTQIEHLKQQILSVAITEKEKSDVCKISDVCTKEVKRNENVLEEIVCQVSWLAHQCGIKMDPVKINNENNYGRVCMALHEIGMHISILNTENDVERSDIEEMLTTAKREIESLTEKNIKIMNDYKEISIEKQHLLQEIEEIKAINKNLSSTSELLNSLKIELEKKSNEIKTMEEKTKQWKDQFLKYEETVQREIKDLVAMNKRLNNIVRSQSQDSLYVSNPQLSESKDIISNEPKSLLTLCCNKLIAAIQRNEIENKPLTTTNSKISIQLENSQTQTDRVECDYERLVLELHEANNENIRILKELSIVSQENKNLKNKLNDLHATNQFLLEEREEVRKEIQMLAEPACELQKKISNHKTHLSTLTATTFAENKLLNSQLKVLKHHHTRYINVCQRDLPAFKTQLNELMAILRECSFSNKQIASFKRYSLPDVLDSNTSVSTLKHESSLDGDLLMLDTNVTLTTVNNTLVGPDQTFLDTTQTQFDRETYQMNDTSKIIDPYIVVYQMETLSHDNQKLVEQIETLSKENLNLKEEIQQLLKFKNVCKDQISEAIKMNVVNKNTSADLNDKAVCELCKSIMSEMCAMKQKLSEDLQLCSTELKKVKEEKHILEQKYVNLSLEVPSTEALIKKLSNAEKENVSKLHEIDKIKNDLNKKNKIIKELQEENDSLSNQVMEIISEVDQLKDENNKIFVKCEGLESLVKLYEGKSNNVLTCTECSLENNAIKALQNRQTESSKLISNLSDSESSSRHNKICTLQNELYASKEDCKKITEEVATIKNQLECNNLSVCQAMDLDESMGDSNIFPLKSHVDCTVEASSSDVSEITLENYTRDKLNCFNFYLEKIGTGKEKVASDFKIIDIMKMLYNNLMTVHGNEVENLNNKLRDFETIIGLLQTQLNNANTEYNKVLKDLEDGNKNISTVKNTLYKMRDSINYFNEEMSNTTDVDKHSKLITIFKENFLKVLDTEFELSFVNIFEALIDGIINEHEKDLSGIVEQYSKQKMHMESIVLELNTLNENLKEMKSQLSKKENEYNLLKAQKERVHEISNAVTLDIVKKEKELAETLTKGCQKLEEFGIPFNPDANLTLNENIKMLFDCLIKQKHNQYILTVERQSSKDEINLQKATLSEKENSVKSLQEKITLSEIQLLKMKKEKENTDLELIKLKDAIEEKEKTWINEITVIQENLQTETKLRHDLTKQYEHSLEENKENIKTIKELTEEICVLKRKVVESEKLSAEMKNLKEKILENDKIINTIENQTTANETFETSDCIGLFGKLECWKQDYENLKSVNQMLIKEKDTYALELVNARELTTKYKKELEKMTEYMLQENQTTANEAFTTSDCTGLFAKLECWKQDYENLKSVNQMLIKEKDTLALELANARTLITKNKIELEKMTEDIFVLRQSVNDNVSIIDKLTLEAKSLGEQNMLLKKEFEDKNQDCARLETNIKTHEKTAQIQTKIINRLQKQEKEDSKALAEKDKLINELMEKNDNLRRECDELKKNLEITKNEMEGLKNKKDSLEAKLMDLESDFQDCHKRRQSIDAIADSARRRRQSLHDSKRAFESEDIEEVFQSRVKPDDLFMDVDGDRSHRNSPTHFSRGRDSWPSAENDEDVPSRPSSVAQTRRRRQSTHDQHRASMGRSASPAADPSAGDHRPAAAARLRLQLDACRQELHELKEKYRELDEECEICAQYLRERDDQCRKLRQDKTALEMQVAELNQKLMLSANVSCTDSRPSVAHAACNTDEDWANLHSVVVDRMSFDAEVEKNKKLSRTIEELRCNKQELRNTIAKMQRALEKNAVQVQSKELEATKEELAQCRQQLEELQERYKELDEECEICAQYLRERDEQCRKLREAKRALEEKLEELSGEVAGAVSLLRKRRQSVHDQNRSPHTPSVAPLAVANTEVTDDLLRYQVERDENKPTTQNVHVQELKQVKKTLEIVMREKAVLENQLAASKPIINPTLYVATGSAIVQNQQITDMMKENHKLKKINAKLISLCKKRGKLNESKRENEEPSDQG